MLKFLTSGWKIYSFVEVGEVGLVILRYDEKDVNLCVKPEIHTNLSFDDTCKMKMVYER